MKSYFFASAAPGTIDSRQPAAGRLRSLLAFERLPQADRPWRASVASFELRPDQLRVHDSKGELVLHTGRYDVTVSIGTVERTLAFYCDQRVCTAAI